MDKKRKIIDILAVGILIEGEKVYPFAREVDGESVSFDPMMVAGMCISVYEQFINHCPENIQIQFEKDFKKYFDDAWKVKEQYMEKRNYD